MFCFLGERFLKDTNKRFISIVSRISLGEEQTQVFRNHGVGCKYWAEIQSELDAENTGVFYTINQVKWNSREGDNIIITIDSLLKLAKFQKFFQIYHILR